VSTRSTGSDRRDVGFVEGAMTSMDPSDADFRTLYWGSAFENVADPAGRTT
jgi:hypothetical protein